MGNAELGKRNRIAALKLAKGLRSTIVPLHCKGWTLRAIAEHLNAKGIPAAHGGQWQSTR